MTDFEFEYTKHYSVNSEAVDDVYYNANERYAVIDLNDRMYRYDNVEESSVQALVDGVGYSGSVGQHFAYDFKINYGPGTYLGHYDESDGVYVDVKTPAYAQNAWTQGAKTVGDFVEASGDGEVISVDFNTKEYSLQTIKEPNGDLNSVLVEQDKFVEDTPEFSLQPIAGKRASRSDARPESYVVVFNGGKTWAPEGVNSVDEAVSALEEVSALLGSELNVTQVVVNFG